MTVAKMTPAKCADTWFALREKRLELQKKVAEIEEQEKEYEAYLIDILPKSSASGIAGKLVRVQIETKTRPTVTDWDKFYTYIKKNNAFELLNKAVSTSGMKERWEAKKEVPGVEKFHYKKLAFSRIKK